MARMVCVWLPNWPLQRLRHERPELRDRAVVLFSNSGNRGPRVVAWSREHGTGINVGMPLAEAEALLGAKGQGLRGKGQGLRGKGQENEGRSSWQNDFDSDCSQLSALSSQLSPLAPQLSPLAPQPSPLAPQPSPLAPQPSPLAPRPSPLALEHDPVADLAALRELARACEAFSPLFGIEQAEAPDCLLVDVAGCTHLFGGEQNLVDALAADFRQRGFEVRMALAPTIGAAWATAHFLAKPHHQPVLTENELEEVLSPLPVTSLRLPPNIVETLHELGLRRIGQLRVLPRETLPSRFGPELLHRIDQAFGDAPELLVPERPSEPIATTWVADEPLTDRESLKIVCQQLLEELIGRLKPRREGIRQLLCQIKGSAARPIELVIHLVSPSDVRKHLLELLSLQIERAELPEGISFVKLESLAVASLVTRQRDLFGFEADSDTQREVSSLLDRLSNRLGPAAVVQAAVVPDAQPEFAVRHEPCILAEGQGPRGKGKEATGNRQQATLRATLGSQPSTLNHQPSTLHSRLFARPLRLFTPPQPIETALAGPEGAPMHFRWNHCDHRVIRSWGPERIETGWWREAPIYRDYFRVETQTGQHFWLFRCYQQAAWFIHGTFD